MVPDKDVRFKVTVTVNVKVSVPLHPQDVHVIKIVHHLLAGDRQRIVYQHIVPALCLAVRHPLRDRKVRGSIPARVKPRTLKVVSAADPPSVWHYGFSAKSGRPGVRIMRLGMVYASAPYITVWQHAFNCPQRRL
ncbi:hypothetical protein ElyMa_000629100 [Elysia marginata]|uniref:Uncharacterized protein n=1 Tax=Elysia marginata TaxID=1093978 RepID=A0AAV4GA59_9GAST|nr:hypothetical protein ElyMa_000629100 [Elysia marginata]